MVNTHAYLLASLSALFTSTAALPSPQTYGYPSGMTAAGLSSFYLVTTSSSNATTNSSSLPNVKATSLFDPYYQPNFFLRIIDPGYGSLPTFNLTDGTLQTLANAPRGPAVYLYNSTTVVEDTELQFLPEEQPAGNLALKGGYLLTVDGESEGGASVLVIGNRGW
ncbi:hypothetical protein H2199_000576 [Coniosporium tulheliwenetii]|uniref:Uncharacterized protein n=1 Tax=Coniosporium tulheliwenetii TaxID=3383036 RepID=A0ACC2ZQK9_9PEZI|nr:hypothetical protein H2199_000576 [Cladosporium sp. JES 115]